jgi:hypothetical protein
MPIDSYLDGRFFDPEANHAMSVAFENVCKQLGLSGQNDPLTRIVARTVIEKAESGVRDADELTAAVMREFLRGRSAPDER